ncbi:hypothetical protein BUALT_Bualt02G0028000 [Buddleja alternifolia]|uniref:Uncharacterized protein n=1 Tax=Buddleja alternifolia TaxID=168488 RepID=A0AAV6XYD7_9LAMI|nr:hypothetical protein BUALT_Bualt02G0028000 [Buddleja alternifolia]
MYNPMKRTLRPLYTLLLLLFVAGTLTIRVGLRQNGSFQLKYEFPYRQTLAKPVFNETLLKFAAIDVGEAKLKQEIDELIEGNFRNRGRQRSFLSSGKYHIDVRLRSSRGTPLQLRSPEFYRIWLSFRRYLSDWWRNRRFYSSDVMLNLVDEVKVLIDEHNGKKGSKAKYKSCAVVGNSGILLKSDYGKMIDSHEAVIRLNNARTATFERNVGSKTSVSFVNSNILHLCARREHCFCHPYGMNVPIVMYICQPAHLLDYLVCNSSHKAPLVVTNPRFDVLCARIVKYYSLKRFVEKTGKDVGEWGSVHEGANFHYSSGMQAVMLALGVCEKISVFGFGKSGLARHHYHTNQKTELSLHDYEAEYDLYRDLMERPEVLCGIGCFVLFIWFSCIHIVPVEFSGHYNSYLVGSLYSAPYTSLKLVENLRIIDFEPKAIQLLHGGILVPRAIQLLHGGVLVRYTTLYLEILPTLYIAARNSVGRISVRPHVNRSSDVLQQIRNTNAAFRWNLSSTLL